MDNRNLAILLLLSSLFFLSLVPAVSTIRLEQRWLTAPFAVFILMLVIVLTSVRYRSAAMRYSLFSLLVFSFLWVNMTYLKMGVPNTYMFDSERTASLFEKAVANNMIHKQTTKLYLWEKKRDENLENGNNWVLDSGGFFQFYGGQDKQLIFVDSIYTKTGVSSFPAFDSSRSQILYFWGVELKDITGEYLRDSLKKFRGKL